MPALAAATSMPTFLQAVTERGRKERLQARAEQEQATNAAPNGNGAVSKASNAVATSRQ